MIVSQETRAKIRGIISTELQGVIYKKYVSNGEADRIADAVVTIVQEQKSFSEAIQQNNETEPRFLGKKGFDEEQDRERLTGQLLRVFAYMIDGEWHTQPEIAEGSQTCITTVRTRLSNLRQKENGGHTVLGERIKFGKGTWHYKMIPNKESLPYKNYLSSLSPHG